ncbi:MAG: type II toxin-antitoxin system VapC family toxin [Spirochaetia bacterium]
MIVVDTNVIVYLYTTTEYSSDAEALLKKDGSWLVPYLWRCEFRNVLAVMARNGMIPLHTAFHIYYEAGTLFSGREYNPDPSEVLRLAYNSGCSAYDCEFISLSRYFGTAFITMDSGLLHAFPETARKLTDYVRR